MTLGMIGFIVGLFVGGTLGVITMALLVANNTDDN